MIGIILLKPKPNKGIMLVLVILQASTVKRLIGDELHLCWPLSGKSHATKGLGFWVGLGLKAPNPKP